MNNVTSIEVGLQKNIFKPFLAKIRKMIALKFKFIISDNDSAFIIEKTLTTVLINYIVRGSLLTQITRRLQAIYNESEGRYTLKPVKKQVSYYKLSITFKNNSYIRYENTIKNYIKGLFNTVSSSEVVKQLIERELQLYLVKSLDNGIFTNITQDCIKGTYSKLINSYARGVL